MNVPKRRCYMLLRHLHILDFRLHEALNILNFENPGWEILFGLIEQSKRRIAHASPDLLQWVVTACLIVWDSVGHVERIRSGWFGFRKKHLRFESGLGIRSGRNFRNNLHSLDLQNIRTVEGDGNMNLLAGMENSLCMERAGSEKNRDIQPERCFHGRDYTPLSLLVLEAAAHNWPITTS